MKHASNKSSLLTFCLITAGILSVVGMLFLGISFAANSTTNTTLGVTAWSFAFSKDVGASMSGYFTSAGYATRITGNTSASIDIGSYSASLAEIAAASSGDHRFTVSDMLGASFTVTIQSSALTASGVISIGSGAVTYSGSSAWVGTGKALTATGANNTSLATPVTFVSRTNNSWLSLFSQDITLKVQIPAAQAPASYTGQLTFTY